MEQKSGSTTRCTSADSGFTDTPLRPHGWRKTIEDLEIFIVNSFNSPSPCCNNELHGVCFTAIIPLGYDVFPSTSSKIAVGEIDDQNELNLLADMLNKVKRRPPDDYICACCQGRAGHHYIDYCPEVGRKKGLTSYQGERQSQADFRCKKCGRNWHSNSAFANTPQTCNNCFYGENLPVRGTMKPLPKYSPLHNHQ